MRDLQWDRIPLDRRCAHLWAWDRDETGRLIFTCARRHVLLRPWRILQGCGSRRDWTWERSLVPPDGR